MSPAALAAPGAPALTAAILCGVSLAASRPQQPPTALAIKFPSIKVPTIKLPDFNIDLPGFGKGKKNAPAPKSQSARPVRPAGGVKVRASSAVQAANPDAPTLDELTGTQTVDSIAAGDGYKKFPSRRMPGANMQNWKKIAADMTRND